MGKPDCYVCKHRADIPGNCHSACRHPDASFAGIMAKKNPLNVAGHPHGIKQGWFIWPVNFDPVWLTNCDGFTPKEIK